MDGWAYTGAPDEYVHGPGIVKLNEKGDCPVCMPRILNEAMVSGVFYREIMPHAVSVGRSNASWHPEVLAAFEKGFTLPDNLDRMLNHAIDSMDSREDEAEASCYEYDRRNGYV